MCGHLLIFIAELLTSIPDSFVFVFLERTVLLLLLYVAEAMMWSLRTIENCKIA
jgi:hypothetical protein